MRRVATISHVIFANLDDPADAPAMLADAEALLSMIPTVRAFSAGPPIDTGRSTVLSDYDVGMILGFDDVEGLRTYLSHPSHVEFLTRWRPKMTGLRIYDIHDPD